MSGKGGKKGRKRPGLSRDDEALWQTFSKQVEPLGRERRAPPRNAVRAEQFDSRETFSPRQGVSKQFETPKQTVSPKTQAVRTKQPAAPTVFDGRQVKRLGTGRTPIEARIDLHGMRQSEAHAALRRFLHRAAANGQRTVLVITGKGAPEYDPQKPWQEAGEGGGRGILKRMVPHWLMDADLRSIVISYATSHPRHGGEGALYVQLSRTKR